MTVLRSCYLVVVGLGIESHNFHSYLEILTHQPSVAAANATAQALLVDSYTETSDSILSLEGQPVS